MASALVGTVERGLWLAALELAGEPDTAAGRVRCLLPLLDLPLTFHRIFTAFSLPSGPLPAAWPGWDDRQAGLALAPRRHRPRPARAGAPSQSRGKTARKGRLSCV